MNAIQFKYAVETYTNVTKSGRFYFQEISKAVNDAIMSEVKLITDSAGGGLDRIQKLRDELYTLIKPAALTITAVGTHNADIYIKHANYPTDYQTFAALYLTIDGSTTYARNNMDYNNRGPMLECSFRRPTNSKPYFIEDATGIKIYLGAGTITTPTLEYIKRPATFNLSTEANYISFGVGVLAINTTYIATEVSVYNGIQYLIGDEFTTGALTTLASGQVLLKSLTTTCDLPEKTHDKIAKKAAEILLGINSAFENSAFAEKEAM